MKFLIPTQELNYLINKILNVVPQKAALPILSNIHIEVSKGILTITATDLTIGIVVKTEVKVLEEGSTTLPAKRFGQLVRELTAPNLQISTNDHHVTEIIANTSKFKINGMNGSEFPKLPDITETEQFRISQSVLKDLLFRVSFAVSRDDTRYVLTGAFMRISEGQITLLGTDGKQLARAHAQINMDPAFSGNYILPLKTVEELLKNLNEEGPATVYLMQDKIAVEAGSTMIISKLIAGDYPDVSRVIPEKSEIVVTLHREELMSLLRQVSLFTADNHHSVKLTFNDGDLTLTANTSEIGEGKVNMPVNYHGPKTVIAFNPGYFLRILGHSREETVTMGITDAYNPGVISEKEGALAHAQAASPLFVLMPMRLSDES